ncbi:hypothetical protein NSK_007625 [Nannochloropsis salina CCMP1776]|uniref:Uncharacterized protein n=1 Tax=Nannochloropsis salina CCMP1776 TaxID=1027361 RepID=A0A4D9CP95_9STRA|nr:hypothetical protein NSK_007625 [Nannochloropsis salina CCMP1776]|eukprot:TFJ80982.1 hypothetical protein NSK_007625 [Nannochloropsis salina CCMP1776]
MTAPANPIMHISFSSSAATASDVKALNSERFDSLVKELLSASDLPALALSKADAFDYHFMSHLMQRLQASTDDEEIAALNKVGEAVNFAMQQRLAKADFILRGILKSGDLKVMEAKMRKHLRANELDTAFDVILNYNAQQAREHEGNEAAANILQHLATLLGEERDKKLPPPTRLLRMLLRSTDEAERQGMLLEKLLLARRPARPRREEAAEGEGEEEEEEWTWGPPEVAPEDLRQALRDFLEEVQAFEDEVEAEVVDRAKGLEREISIVVQACG